MNLTGAILDGAKLDVADLERENPTEVSTCRVYAAEVNILELTSLKVYTFQISSCGYA
ncbi:MAG: hypothetical protein SFY66_18130 [Oculatellaceae cyanobacterium bins.114]|nr:hypothetical protein [Oculatellaceae cyanobacterium bins.114]